MGTKLVARLLARIVVFTILSLLLGCAGEGKSVLGGAALRPVTGGTPAPLNAFAGFPPLPLDVPGHTVASTQNKHVDGIATFARSTGVIEQGTNLLLFTTVTNPPTLEWGLYRYVPDNAVSEVVQSASLVMTVNAGLSSWLGIANYTTGMWEFRGPYGISGGPSKDFNNLDSGGYLSPGGNLYFLAAAYNGSTCTVGGIDVTSDITPPVTYSISGVVTDTSTSQGMPNVSVDLRLGGNLVDTQLTNINGVYTFIGLAPGSYSVIAPTIADYSVQPLNIPVSVGPDSSGNDFDATPIGPPPVTYETGAGIMKDKMNTYCIGCHGDDKQDPDSPFLRTYAEIEAWVNDGNSWDAFAFLVTGPFKDMPEDDPEKAAIDAAGDRHWWDDWIDNNHAQ